MLVTVLMLLGCVALLGAWRSGGLDETPVPPPPGGRAAVNAAP